MPQHRAIDSTPTNCLHNLFVLLSRPPLMRHVLLAATIVAAAGCSREGTPEREARMGPKTPQKYILPPVRDVAKTTAATPKDIISADELGVPLFPGSTEATLDQVLGDKDSLSRRRRRDGVLHVISVRTTASTMEQVRDFYLSKLGKTLVAWPSVGSFQMEWNSPKKVQIWASANNFGTPYRTICVDVEVGRHSR